MTSEKTYICQSCKRTAIGEPSDIPRCCGQTMEQMPREICIQPAHPEHARPMEDEDACDEFREGR